MRIICDQDEVLAQFVNKVLKRWNAVNGTDFKREQVNCWRMETVLGIDKLGRSAEGLIDEWMQQPGFFEKLEPMPGAIEGFNALRKMGHDVIVATSIPEVAVHAFDGKRRWMRKHFPDWSMKNFISCSRKGLLTGDLLIDDGSHNIKDWLDNDRGAAVVFDAPWNQEIKAELGVVRLKSWEEIIDWLERTEKIRQDLEEIKREFSQRRLYPNGVRFKW